MLHHREHWTHVIQNTGSVLPAASAASFLFLPPLCCAPSDFSTITQARSFSETVSGHIPPPFFHSPNRAALFPASTPSFQRQQRSPSHPHGPSLPLASCCIVISLFPPTYIRPVSSLVSFPLAHAVALRLRRRTPRWIRGKAPMTTPRGGKRVCDGALGCPNPAPWAFTATVGSDRTGFFLRPRASTCMELSSLV